MHRLSSFLLRIAGGLSLVVLWAGCDAAITGTPFENQPPTTQLSVRDSSLVDNLAGADRLTSSVMVSWTGDDPDGYVQAYELRYYDEGSTPPDTWSLTSRNDTLILLPIPRGERVADVVFEVRAIDNEGLKDPTPARTVYPIQNSPPTLRLSRFELPPDTTFTIVSFAWDADDPEGEDNLAAIEVSFNDSTSYTRLPADTRFVTFVAAFDPNDPTETTTSASVRIGRGFQGTGIDVPGLRLDAENTFYVRAVDQTDTTSVFERHTWFVKKPKSDVLFVNDFRKITAPTVQAYHLSLLRDFLPEGTPINLWDVTQPYSTGNTGDLVRSDAMPPVADPTLRHTFGLFRYIYWVSSNTTNSTADNNLPYAAAVMDLFFENGGKLIVHSPANIPSNPEENLGNPAILLMPLSDLMVFPDSIYQFFRLPRGRTVTPTGLLPGVSEPLPALQPLRLISDVIPYYTEGDANIPLYTAPFNAIRRADNRQVPWTGVSNIASISNDRRVVLVGFPLVDDRNGESLYTGADGNPDAPRQAVHLMLRSLGFPE
ncbi:hypothetical protein AWN76_002020 [Rhodothermaceae bacterium RA]|nr:hypothetical protein AWN76_002020 [Rhodothermaceae bacterium RA]